MLPVKLGMKLTLVLLGAFLVGLLAGGGWLRWASHRDTQARVHQETLQVLESMASSLSPMVRAGDQESIGHFLGFVRGILPVRGRIEVEDRRGTRLAQVGVPPREGKGIYFPLVLEGEGPVGAVQVFLDEGDLRRLAREGQRPGGSALFVGMMVAWIVTEILGAFVLFSPVKKLHRALLRARRREGPVDLELLTEELRTRGRDELDAILTHTRELLLRVRRERLPGQLEVLPSREAGASSRERDGELPDSGEV